LLDASGIGLLGLNRLRLLDPLGRFRFIRRKRNCSTSVNSSPRSARWRSSV
jgi:hypothetical protein